MSSQYSADTGSSTTSVTVIAVCAAVGGAFVLFVVVRVSLYAYRRKRLHAAPLPPVQPLAHHRESKWAPASRISVSDRYSFHNISPVSPLRTSSDPMCHSAKPLLHYDSSSLRTPSDQPTSPDDWRSSIFASLSPVVQQAPDYPLAPPHPLYARQGLSRNSDGSSGQVSYNSDNEDSDGGTSSVPISPQGGTQVPDEYGRSHERHRSLTAPPFLTQEMIAQRRLTRQARPVSVAHSISSVVTTDTTRSVRSMRSASQIRGAPHRPHSRVEIVLPSPLAPSIYPSSTLVGQAPPLPGELAAAIAEASLRESRTLSVCDPWLPLGRTAAPPALVRDGMTDGLSSRRHSQIIDTNTEKGARSRLSRMSISSTAIGAVANNVRTSVLFRASSSAQATSTLSRSTSPEPPQLPPVPAVPSIYTTLSEKVLSGLPQSRNGSRAPSAERKSGDKAGTPCEATAGNSGRNNDEKQNLP